jgi:2'-5' RNA ligase
MPDNNPGTLRLFVAIELPEAVKHELTHLQQSLKKACGNCPARWVSAENIHLTLNFLGNIDACRLAEIEDAVMQTGAVTEGFELTLADAGAFPNMERPRVVWVGIQGDLKRLTMLQKYLEQSLSRIGFAPEPRIFSPHLTLARVGDEALPAARKRLGEAAGAMTCGTRCQLPVRSISLIQSHLTPSGPIYTVLMSSPLRQTA